MRTDTSPLQSIGERGLALCGRVCRVLQGAMRGKPSQPPTRSTGCSHYSPTLSSPTAWSCRLGSQLAASVGIVTHTMETPRLKYTSMAVLAWGQVCKAPSQTWCSWRPRNQHLGDLERRPLTCSSFETRFAPSSCTPQLHFYEGVRGNCHPEA